MVLWKLLQLDTKYVSTWNVFYKAIFCAHEAKFVFKNLYYVITSHISIQPTCEQADALQEAFVNSLSAHHHGIHFNGATYKCVRADKESIYAKKVSVHCSLVPQLPKLTQFIHDIVQEGSGFIAVSTNKLIVYGSYSSAMNPSICVEAVERVGMF